MPKDCVEALSVYRVSNSDRSVARRRTIAVYLSFASFLSLLNSWSAQTFESCTAWWTNPQKSHPWTLYRVASIIGSSGDKCGTEGPANCFDHRVRNGRVAAHQGGRLAGSLCSDSWRRATLGQTRMAQLSLQKCFRSRGYWRPTSR